MPEIEYVFLADAAEARPGQKFAVLGGGISRIGGQALPIRHPHLALVVGLRVAPGELGRDHDVGFQLLRPDGTEVASAAARIRADGVPGADDTIMTFSVDLWNLVFETPGAHSLRVAVNGAERKRLPLAVDQVVGEGPIQPPFPAPIGQA
ncbi:MAG: hypothetical protein EPN50_08235 [Chloroflexota bacterium]|nr:MAG: hypothetical protein EPN50_08235 [Chloroflexota bacterium]